MRLPNLMPRSPTAIADFDVILKYHDDEDQRRMLRLAKSPYSLSSALPPLIRFTDHTTSS